MKNYYFTFILIVLFFVNQSSYSQVRITEVNPPSQSIKIKNFGASAIDISSYWICSRIRYGVISNMTILNGDYNLGENEEVEFTSSVDLDNTSADLGLYSVSGSFGSPTAMLDFLQWGAAGIGRESVAVEKGIWTKGDFISVSSTYEFNGEVSELGLSFWQTSILNIDENIALKFSIYPNPSSEFINVQLPQSMSSGEVTIYNFSGKVVLKEEVYNIKSAIDIDKLSKGNYLLKLVSGDEIGVKQFIKK